MYDAYICVPRTLTLMLVCMMHISMILDSCMYDARMVHASMMRTFLGTDILLMGGAAAAAAGANRGTMGLG